MYYLGIVFLLFISSTYIASFPIKKGHGYEYEMRISKKAEIALLSLILISLVSLALYVRHLRTLFVLSDYIFAGGDYRDVLSVERPLVNKIEEVLINLGVVSYLIIARIRKVNFKYTKTLSLIGLILPAVSILAVGARGRVITTIGLYIIVNNLNRHEEKNEREKRKRTKKSLAGILIASAIFIFLIIFTMQLFKYRGVIGAQEAYLKSSGDMDMKPFYENLLKSSNYGMNELYKALIYYTHSVPTFSWAYDKFGSMPIYHGALLFFLEGYILRLFGIDFPNYIQISASSPAAGLYSTFVTGYIMDWGKFGTILAIVVTGFAFGYVTRNQSRKGVSYFILPVILFMCWVAPVYYFLHMGWESVLLLFFLVYPIVKKLGLHAVRIS